MYKLKEKLPIYRQNDFAKEIGISQQHLSRIQNGKQTCSKSVAYCITKGFKADAKVEDFFEEIKD